MKRLDCDLIDGATDFTDTVRRHITQNIGQAVAIITAIAAVLLCFLEVALPELSYKSITVEVAVLLLASYIIYFSLLDAGEGYGRSTDVYKESEAAYMKVRAQIGSNMIDELRQYLVEYASKEAEHKRRMLLVGEAVSLEDYRRYKNGEKMPTRLRRACKKADAIRPRPINPRLLLEREERGSEARLVSPRASRPISELIKLIPMTLSTLFTVSLIITTKDGLTAATVLESLIKLSCLPIVALRGYIGGYKYATEELSAWYDKRREMLAAFLEWHEGKAQKLEESILT